MYTAKDIANLDEKQWRTNHYCSHHTEHHRQAERERQRVTHLFTSLLDIAGTFSSAELVDIARRFLYIGSPKNEFAPSSNGKTADSGSVYRGSNPCGAAADMALSSNGLGRSPLKAEIRVRFPLRLQFVAMPAPVAQLDRAPAYEAGG